MVESAMQANEEGASSKPTAVPTPSELMATLSNLLFKVYEMEVLLGAEDSDATTALTHSLAAYHAELAGLSHGLRQPAGQPGREALDRRRVPSDMLGALDAGVNPDDYLRTAFLCLKRDNQVAAGKVGALQQLHAALLGEAAEMFGGAG